MKPAKLPLHGRCRCGTIRFAITAMPLLTSACHCKACRAMSSSAFSLTAVMPADGFAVTQGAPVEGGAKTGEIRHFICPDCGAWMFTRIPGFEQIVNVRPVLLEDTGWITPFIETWTSEKLHWVTTPALHSFETFPTPDAFVRLAEDYARL